MRLQSPLLPALLSSTMLGALASSMEAEGRLQVNTNAVVLVNKAMCHLEGGWPKEVDCTEVEQVIRYRRKAGLLVTLTTPVAPDCVYPKGGMQRECKPMQAVGEQLVAGRCRACSKPPDQDPPCGGVRPRPAHIAGAPNPKTDTQKP